LPKKRCTRCCPSTGRKLSRLRSQKPHRSTAEGHGLPIRAKKLSYDEALDRTKRVNHTLRVITVYLPECTGFSYGYDFSVLSTVYHSGVSILGNMPQRFIYMRSSQNGYDQTIDTSFEIRIR